MKLQKNRKNVFTPKKVRMKTEHEKVHMKPSDAERAAKLVKGRRFGRRWFPYDK